MKKFLALTSIFLMQMVYAEGRLSNIDLTVNYKKVNSESSIHTALRTYPKNNWGLLGGSSSSSVTNHPNNKTVTAQHEQFLLFGKIENVNMNEVHLRLMLVDLDQERRTGFILEPEMIIKCGKKEEKNITVNGRNIKIIAYNRRIGGKC